MIPSTLVSSSILLSCILALPEAKTGTLHGGHGGGGSGHGGGFGHGGYGFHHRGGYGFPRFGYGVYPGFGLAALPPPPYPPPIFPPLPVAGVMPAPPVAGISLGNAANFAQVGFGSVAPSVSLPMSASYATNSGGFVGQAPQLNVVDGGFSGNNGASAQASARISVSGAGMQQPAMAPPQVLVAQAPFLSNGANFASASANMNSGMGGQMINAGRRFNQGTDGLQIDVDGQGQPPPSMPPQGPPPMPQSPPPMQDQPAPPMMPPQPAPSSLVKKGFVRKSASFQEQKSGSSNSNKEFEVVTTRA